MPQSLFTSLSSSQTQQLDCRHYSFTQKRTLCSDEKHFTAGQLMEMGQWVKHRLLSNLKGGDKQKEKSVICLPASLLPIRNYFLKRP